MSKVIYGVCLAPEEAASLAVAVRPLHPEYTLVTSLTGSQDGVAGRLLNDGAWERIEAVGELCGPLVRSVADAWPRGKANAEILMEQEPQHLNGWVLRNLLWQFACGGFVWWVTDDTCHQQDLTVHLTVAKMFGQLTIGILPSATRQMLESTQLTLTDCCLVEADTRSLAALLGSLTKDPKPPLEAPTDG